MSPTNYTIIKTNIPLRLQLSDKWLYCPHCFIHCSKEVQTECAVTRSSNFKEITMQTSILKLPLCWAVNPLEGKWAMKNQILCPAPKLKDPDNFLYKQNSPIIPAFFYLFFLYCRSFLGSGQKKSSELSKLILSTKKPLDNSPTQINTNRRLKKMALVSLVPTIQSTSNYYSTEN